MVRISYLLLLLCHYTFFTILDPYAPLELNRNYTWENLHIVEESFDLHILCTLSTMCGHFNHFLHWSKILNTPMFYFRQIAMFQFWVSWLWLKSTLHVNNGRLPTFLHNGTLPPEKYNLITVKTCGAVKEVCYLPVPPPPGYICLEPRDDGISFPSRSDNDTWREYIYPQGYYFLLPNSIFYPSTYWITSVENWQCAAAERQNILEVP